MVLRLLFSKESVYVDFCVHKSNQRYQTLKGPIIALIVLLIVLITSSFHFMWFVFYAACLSFNAIMWKRFERKCWSISDF